MSNKYIAEKIFLGEIIEDNSKLDFVTQIISPEALFFESSQQVYRKMIELFKEDIEFDTATLISTFSDDKEDISEFIIECSELSYMAKGKFMNYVRQINEKHLNRQFKRKAQEIVEKNIKPGMLTKEIQQFTSELEDIRDNKIIDDNKSNFTDDLSVFVDKLEQEAKNPSSVMKTGFETYDNKFGGFKRKRLHVISARPSCGKTTLMLNLLLNVAKQGHKAVFFSLEMTKREIIARLLSRILQIENTLFDNPSKLTNEHWSNIMKTIQNIADNNIVIYDNINKLSKIQIKVHQENPDVVFIDYLQIASLYYPNAHKRSQELSYATQDLKKLAKKTNSAIWIASQLNRSSEGQSNAKYPKPKLSQNKGSGGFEEDADVVWLIYWLYGLSPESNPDNGLAWSKPDTRLFDVILAKNRHGSKAMFTLQYMYEYSEFLNK